MSDQEEMVTAAEAAKLKGIHIKSLYLAIQTGRLPATKYYGRVLIKRSDLDAWQPIGHRPKNKPAAESERESGG
jgi:excisionase family DNA binding protein